MSQPGQERFDVFTQAGQSGDQEEAAHGPSRRIQQEASHEAMRPDDIQEPEPEMEMNTYMDKFDEYNNMVMEKMNING